MRFQRCILFMHVVLLVQQTRMTMPISNIFTRRFKEGKRLFQRDDSKKSATSRRFQVHHIVMIPERVLYKDDSKRAPHRDDSKVHHIVTMWCSFGIIFIEHSLWNHHD